MAAACCCGGGWLEAVGGKPGVKGVLCRAEEVGSMIKVVRIESVDTLLLM